MKNKDVDPHANCLVAQAGLCPARDPLTSSRATEEELRDDVFACANLNATAEEIIRWFVMRWSSEGAFEEAYAFGATNCHVSRRRSD